MKIRGPRSPVPGPSPVPSLGQVRSGVAVGLALMVLVSCRSAPNRGEKYDEVGGDPDSRAAAIVEALKQMKAEGAGPRRIVAMSDFFFENYPFSISDLAVPEEPFLAVAEIQFEAATQLVAETPACSEFSAASTVGELKALLEKWTEPHEDGGRCAKRFYDVFRTAKRQGFEIELDPSFLKWGENEEPYSGALSSLFRAAKVSLGNSPWYAAAAFHGARLDSWTAQQRRHRGWLEYRDLGFVPRWLRIWSFRATAWDCSRRGSGDLAFDDVAEPMEKSRFDPRLREVGRAIRGYLENRELKSTEELIRVSKGTPIADRARHQAVIILMGKNKQGAVLWLRDHLADFEHPFLAAHSLLVLTDGETHQKSIELAKAALRLAPDGPSAITAWSIQADAYGSAGKTDPELECLLRALAPGPYRTGEYEDETADISRSESGRKLARLYQGQKKWKEALVAWQAWEIYTWSTIPSGSQEDEKNLGIAECLEALGRVAESADFYWEAAISQSEESVEVARKLDQIHKSLGTWDRLKEKVREEVESYDDRSRVKFGLKWLADELGIP